MYFGLEKPGITGGDGCFALPLLLGGVLKGETSAVSDEASGAKEARVDGSVECGLLGILGFPARFIGGGTGGADEVGRSPLRGSAEDATLCCAGNRGFESNEGVASRLGILKVFDPLVADAGVEGESNAACDVGRDGRGEWI